MLSPLNRVIIHLDQIRWNYLAVQSRLRKGSDCAAVVKADAYGLGAGAIVPELYRANCRHFYVAYAGEGIAVRRALSGEAHVYVLHGPQGAAEDLQKNNLTPVLNTVEDIELWSSLARKAGKKLPAVIHIDTGMNRLGLSAAEVIVLKNNIDILKPLDLRYVMSHLACADDPMHPKNEEQKTLFQRLAAQLGLPCRLSFANSAGIFLGEEYHFDQVRPGCALYGMNSHPTMKNVMQGTVTLQARILQIREAKKGETVGYGATYKVSSPSKLATISVGYADGYLRSLTGHGRVHIAGQVCPVVGRVSMDAIVADVTALVKAPQVGDWAEIIGPHQTVDDVAAQAGTIGYEILTSLGKRYERIYTGQDKA